MAAALLPIGARPACASLGAAAGCGDSHMCRPPCAHMPAGHGRAARAALGLLLFPRAGRSGFCGGKSPINTLDPCPHSNTGFKLGGWGATDTVHRPRIQPQQCSLTSVGRPHASISQQERREQDCGLDGAALGLPAAPHLLSRFRVSVRGRRRGVAAARGRTKVGLAPRWRTRPFRATGCGKASQR